MSFSSGISDTDKEALVFRMAYNRDMPKLSTGVREAILQRAKNRGKKKSKEEKEENVDRFDEGKVQRLKSFFLVMLCFSAE